MKKVFLVLFFLSTVFSQDFLNHKYENRIQKEIDNIYDSLIETITDKDNPNYLINCLDILDRIYQLEKSTSSVKSKQKLSGAVIIYKTIMLINFVKLDVYKQEYIDFGYNLYDEVMHYDYVSIFEDEHDINLDSIVFELSDNDYGYYNRFLLRNKILENIGFLESVENKSKIMNKRFALYEEVFESDNYQDTIKMLNAIQSIKEKNQYLSFQLGFNDLVFDSITSSVGQTKILENFSKLDLEEIFYYYEQTSNDIYDFFNGDYNIQDLIGDDLNYKQRIDKYGLPQLDGHSNLSSDEFLRLYTINKINMLSIIAILFTHVVPDPDKARIFFEQALNILNRPEINLKDIALNNYSENDTNLESTNRQLFTMSIGKLLSIRLYQTIDIDTTEFLVDMAKEFIAVCNQNAKCYNHQGEENFWTLDYLSFMVGFDKEMTKLVQMNDTMNLSLVKNERYRELSYEISIEDWSEEDHIFMNKFFENYVNENIPKVDDFIQDFFIHLEEKNFPPAVYEQLTENLTYIVTSTYDAYFNFSVSQLSEPSEKIALDMIKKYPKKAVFVNRYFSNALNMSISNEEIKDEYVANLLKVLNQGYLDVFENIKLKDIQENPSLFSQEILLALYHNWATDSKDFDSLFKQIIRYDKISNILSVQDSEQLFLDYFEVSEEQLNQVGSSLASGIHDIITFRLRDDGITIEDALLVNIIRLIYDSEDEELIDMEIIPFEIEILTSDIDLSNFFYGSNIDEDQSYNPIGEKILLFQQALNQNNESEIYRSGYFFYKWLFGEIENYLAEEKLALSEDILIIADPALKNIPFEALHNEENYLTEKYSILYQNSFEDYYQDMSNFVEKYRYIDSFEKDYNPRVVAIGDIDYGKINESDFFKSRNITLDNLEWSNYELNTIKSFFGNKNTNIISGKSATESFIKNYDFSNVDILHLSTHGIVDSQDYKNSSIILNPDKNNNGLFSYKEIEILDLTNVDLVFLSACDTNKGEGFRNIDLLSLQKAFNIAGAKNVIATLWQIEDKPASLFTEIFYTYYKDNPLNVGLALAETKTKFYNTYPEYRSPHYWAAFVAY